MDTTCIGMDYQSEENDTWMIDTSGRYGTIIKNYLIADGIPEAGADKIIQNAAKVLGYCPNPEKDDNKQLTGIVIGKVQSGKTSNFISLTALAFDNGYSHVVVFGGTKNELLKQNSDRIKEYFKVANDVVVLNSTDHKSQLNSKQISQIIKMGKKIIIVALKTPGQINTISNSIFSDCDLREKPVLIIDDEGDEASLNTLVKKGKKSSTYKAIESLKSKLLKHCFLSVTATPQANLLIDSMDVLSPDFGVLVDPGKGYCGLNAFHVANSPYMIEIPDDETSLLDEGIPASFNDALATFFVACGIFASRGRKPGNKLSMLIHPSQLKVDHSIVKKKTEKIVEKWRQLASNPGDIAYASLGKRLKNAYEEYEKKGISDLPDFVTVEKKALESIEFCTLHIVNGDSVPNGADDIFDYNIYIGGAMLGRGLTLKGLTITYIIRTAKGTSTVDTVQQRARWFGYKSKYLDLCRIFAVKKIAKEFREIREHEEDLWETVRDANLSGTRFKDIARIFVLSDDLRMTRTSVAATERRIFKLWNIQNQFLSNDEYLSSNKAIIEKFRTRNQKLISEQRFGDGKPYTIISGLSYDSVYEQLISKLIFPSESKIDSGMFQKLKVLLVEKSIIPNIDVIWMREGATSKHLVSDVEIPNYMVGRRPDDNSKPEIYAGDRYQFVTEDTMQLQIHMIEDSNTHIVSPTIAFYIPKCCIEKLTNLVIRS
jgi:hypothetical protein